MTYKTSEAVRKRQREGRFRRRESERHNLLRSDSLRAAMLSSVEVDWAVRLIRALKERHL